MSGEQVIPPARGSEAGSFALTGDITTATISANQNNYNPSGLSSASILRLASDASRNITGIAGGSDGRILLLCNIGSQNIVLVHDATSTAANRFYCPNGINFTLLPNTFVLLVYDATSTRWRVDGAPADDVAANPSLRTLGTGAAQAAAGDDSRLSDSRPPNGAAGGDLGGTYPNPTAQQAAEDWTFAGVLTPATITANQDDYNPTGLSTTTVLRLASDASRNITGVQGGASGRVLIIANVGAQNIVLVHDATSTAANRFYCPNGINFTLLPNTKVEVIYDATSSRWRFTGAPTDDVAANPSLRTLGTGAAQACAGNDSRLSDSRPPNGSASGDLSGTFPSPAVAQASAAFALTGDISPAQITANQDDYNPTGLSTATILRLSTDASRNLTGIQGGADGRVLVVMNVGSNPLELIHDATSAVANRFYCPNAIDKTILPNTFAILAYDSTSSRWRVLGAPDDDVAANPSLRTLGTGAAQACAGNDSRLSDSRAPSGSAGGDLSGTYPNPAVAQVSAAFAVPGDISPAAIAANTDDYNPPNLSTATVLRLSTDASRNLTGIQGGADGRILVVANVGSNNLVLVHDATSAVANRFYCPNGVNLTLLPNMMTVLVYDSTSTRWRVLGHPVDGTAAIPSVRTLGTAATQAAAGDHTHATSPKSTYLYHNPILAGTNYLPLGGTNSGLEVKTTCPAAFTLKNLRIQLRTAPGVGNTLTVTLRRNGINTSVSASIADTNTTGSDLVNTQAYSAGDDISIAIVLNAGAPGDLTIAWQEDYTTS